MDHSCNITDVLYYPYGSYQSVMLCYGYNSSNKWIKVVPIWFNISGFLSKCLLCYGCNTKEWIIVLIL